jgi:hypothetical protein
MGDDESDVGGRKSEVASRPPPIPATTDASAGDALSTVGTGSVLGIGCLVVVVLLIVIAIAFRWFGGSW